MKVFPLLIFGLEILIPCIIHEQSGVTISISSSEGGHKIEYVAVYGSVYPI